MNVLHPSERALGFPDDTRFALTIARQGRGAGFAPRSSRSSSYDDDEEPREERPRRSSSQVGTSWLIAGFVLAVGVVIVLIFAQRGGTPNLLTFQEFQDRISIPQGGQRYYPPMSAKEYVARTGLPIPGTDYDDANYVFFSYRVKEGVVQVAMDKPSWKVNRVQIVRITLQQ